MDIGVLFRVLLDRKWILILVPLLTAIVAFIVMSFSPKEYKSKAQLSTGFTINNEVTLADGGFNAREAEIKFGNLMETLRSPIIIGMVSYKLMVHDLTEQYPFKTIEDEELETVEDSGDSKAEFYKNLTKEEIVSILNSKIDSISLLTSYKEKEKQLLELLEVYGYDYESIIDNLDLKRANYSDYVNIEFVSTNPQWSAFVVNTLLEEVIRYNNIMNSDRADKSLEYYNKLVAQKREEMEEKSEALKIFKSSNQVLNFNAENESNVAQIANLEVKLQEEERNVYGLRLALQNIDRRLSDAGSGSGSGNNSTNAQLIRVRDQLNKLNQKFRETGSPAIQRSIDSLRQVQIDLAAASSSFSQGGEMITRQDLVEEREQLKIELAVAQRSLNSIQSTLGLLRGSATGLASKEATISALQREVDLASEEYLEAQEKFNAAKNVSQGSGNSIRPVLYGQPAVNPESSKKMIITALAWALSFSLCIVGIVFMEFVDVSIKTVPQLEKLTHLTTIGTINYIDPRYNDLSTVFSDNDSNKDIAIFKHLLRKLRYEVESVKGQIVLVTSTKQGEGKTFTILSLAYSLSLVQKKILLIDTNFKNNSLTQMLLAKPQFDKLLESSNQRHKQKLLVSTEDFKFEEPEDYVKENYKKAIISPTYLKNIDIIGSKGGDGSPAEILSGRNFKEVLGDLSGSYDYIFLEGASLNDYSDTKELVEYADIVLPVFSAQSVIKQMDKESIAYLKRLNDKLIGTVLNKVNTEDLNI